MINAFHSNWTKPFFAFNKGKDYFIDDFEILTTILSALKWRENNGSIKMVTDEIGAEYYRKIGIEGIWDQGIDVTLDGYIDKDISCSTFWAAGKIFSLKRQSNPCAMIDTDFIVWKSLEYILSNVQIATIHKEYINEDVYPGRSYFKMKKGYNFDCTWDWSVLPCNTAFTYITNEEFKSYYVNTAIDFMKNSISDGNRITNMVFAEQRLIAICARKMNIDITELADFNKLLNNGQSYFTHTWGYKDVMRHDYEKRRNFCIRCIDRIIKDFPQYERVLANMKELKGYFE